MASISGRLTSDGVALAGAGITLSDASGDVEDSFAVTDESGNFQTLYLVPEEQAEGDLEVTSSSRATVPGPPPVPPSPCR